MILEELIGFIAGSLTTFCFLPQALKIIKEKDVRGVSLATYIIFGSGVILWFIYGILLSSLPIIIFNGLTFLITIAIIINIIKHSKKTTK